MSLEGTLSRVQRMLLHSAAYVRDAKIEIGNLCFYFLSKDKVITDANSQIQKLNSTVTSLLEKQTSLEAEVKTLKEAKTTFDLRGENLKKQVFELIERINGLELSVRKAEQAVVDGAFDAERNILDQIKLRAPD
ncbi:hypothetical protein HN873_060903 [Arachis hypogaea]